MLAASGGGCGDVRYDNRRFTRGGSASTAAGSPLPEAVAAAGATGPALPGLVAAASAAGAAECAVAALPEPRLLGATPGTPVNSGRDGG